MKWRIVLVLLPLLLSACQSDEELCEDVQKKLRECGGIPPRDCPETLRDELREQYECIVDKECSEIGECAG